MEEDVDDVLDWLESIETLVDARVMIIARVLFPRWSCQDHVRHEMTFCGRFFFPTLSPSKFCRLFASLAIFFFFQKEFIFHSLSCLHF